jgi:acyl-CoA thioesterase YciA
MEHITTFLVKASDIGLSNNMFGGVILSLIDESAISYAMQLCDTPRMVTVKIDELVFKKPVKVGNLLKVYGNVIEFGNSSISIYIEVRKHNVYNGKHELVNNIYLSKKLLLY